MKYVYNTAVVGVNSGTARITQLAKLEIECINYYYYRINNQSNSMMTEDTFSYFHHFNLGKHEFAPHHL